MNFILCPECVALLYPDGVEEQTCGHGRHPRDECARCFKRKVDDKPPFFKCLGRYTSAGVDIRISRREYITNYVRREAERRNRTGERS